MTDRRNAPFASFNPPDRILMGPGPSQVHARVTAAMARPTIGHLDPEFIRMMDELKELLRLAFRTKNDVTFPLPGPGSLGMEACFVNLVEPGDTVVVARNGAFGGRMKENVERSGGRCIVVDDAWGQPVDVAKVEAALKGAGKVKALGFVHAETSTGAQSDAAALCALAAKYGALSIVDTVTSLGGTPVELDAWGADAVYSGSQKCLSCPPGLSPVSFSERALAAVAARKTPVQSWLLDLNLILAYWRGSGGARSYHHTAPVNALYGLHESLVMLLEEGLENAWARHRRLHDHLAGGLKGIGLDLLVDPAHRLPQLNAVKVPAGVDEAKVRRTLLDRYGIEIGAGLGALAGKVWRIGLMGQSCSERHVALCVTALKEALSAA